MIPVLWSVCAFAGFGVGEDASPDAAPARIVTIGPSTADLICRLGACDRIVGVDRFCVHPRLGDRLRVGGLVDPNLERIAALTPDLIVLRGHNESIESLARARGITLYHDRTDSFADLETTVRDLGRLLHRTDEAERLIVRFRERLERIRRRVAGRPRPRVVVTLARRPDRLADLLVAAPGTFLHETIEIAGGRNVFEQLDVRYPQVSPESILARQPEVILELMPEAGNDPQLLRRVRKQWRSLGSMPAVATGRIYVLTDARALIPSLEYPEIVERIARLLHPEVFGGP